jgi:DNA-binding MarR family transcriptional regulator
MEDFKTRDPDELQRNIAYLITDIARLYRTNFDREMKALGLNRSEWWLISYLCYFNGSTQQTLSELLDIGNAGMTKLVDRLEASGVVRRKAHGKDRRSKRIYLTERSMPIAGEVDKASDRAIAESLSAMGEDQQAQLRTVLTDLRNMMKTRSGREPTQG